MTNQKKKDNEQPLDVFLTAMWFFTLIAGMFSVSIAIVFVGLTFMITIKEND